MSRTIRRIVCHHTDSAPTTDAATIRGWHVDGNGWSDIGYHWVIRQTADGEWMTEQGRPESRTGSHEGFDALTSQIDTVGRNVGGLCARHEALQTKLEATIPHHSNNGVAP